MWKDTDTVLGTVPSAYANYQMLRGVAQHINLHDDCSITLSAGTHTLIYAHPTLNAAASYQPGFLSSWSVTGNTGTITIPDRDGVDEDVPVTYYSKAVSGTFTWNFLEATWSEPLSYFPGVILIPAGVTVSAIYPAIYKVVADISAVYADLDGDWWWDPAPATAGTATQTATSWADFHTKAEAASAGHVIAINAGTYNNDGDISIDNLVGTAASPIFLDLSGATLTGSTALSLNNCDYVRVYGGVQGVGTGNSSLTRLNIESDCTFCSIENFDGAAGSQTLDSNVLNTIAFGGMYNRVSNCRSDGQTSRGNFIAFNPTTGSNSADQFCLIQYNDLQNMNAGDTVSGGQNTTFIRLGGNNNFNARAYSMVRRNYLENYHKTPDDTEWMVVKSCGHIISQNVYVATSTSIAGSGFFTRVGSWNYFVGNYHDANSNSANMGGPNLQGSDDTSAAEYLTTHLIHARNFVKDFDGTNGYIQLNQKSSTSSNRWVALDCLVTQQYSYAGVDQILKFGASSNTVAPTGHKYKSLALTTSTSLCTEDYDSSTAVTFDSCVSDASSNGFSISGLPTGLTEASLTWADRGDGVWTTDHASLTPTVIDCIPVQIQGSTISNVGLQ